MPRSKRVGAGRSVLDETNYREFALKVIGKYAERGMFVDAEIWRQIVELYERALEKKS